VAISGDYAIAGAQDEDTGGSNAGAAYVFKRDGTSWAQEAKIVASDPEASDEFGCSVAISGGYANVGAIGGGDAGAAYIYNAFPTTAAAAAFFDVLNITVTGNRIKVEMDVTNVSSGWTGTLYNETLSETITITETFVETTLKYSSLSNGDWVFTATASDGVEYVSNTVNIDIHAIFDVLTLTATDNSLAVEMEVTNVLSGWTGILENETTSETVTIAETFVETTLNYADISNGDWVFTATAGDGVEYVSNTVTVDYTPPPPTYRYLAFYGEAQGSNYPTFQEIQLTLGTPLNGSSEIKAGENSSGVTFHASQSWSYSGGNYYYSTIMNGDPRFVAPKLQYQYVQGVSAIYWYMDLGSGVAADVNGGTFWTYSYGSGADFALGKLYGTNTDPATFGNGSLTSNYVYICDLSKQNMG
jgi:hypothetical protein